MFRKLFNGYVFINGCVEGLKVWYICFKGFFFEGFKECICVGEIWDGCISCVRCKLFCCLGLLCVDNGVFCFCNYMSYVRVVGIFNNFL